MRLPPRKSPGRACFGHNAKMIDRADWDWMNAAKCAELAPDWELIDRYFFPVATSSHGPSQHVEWVARRLCAQCPVRRECLDYALSMEGDSFVHPIYNASKGQVNEYVILEGADGTWGGLTENERESTLGLPPAKRQAALDAIFAEKAREVLLPWEVPAVA